MQRPALYVNSPYGITLAHNGNLTNVEELTEAIFRADLRHINTSSDSEVLLNVFAHELQKLGKLTPPRMIFLKQSCPPTCQGLMRSFVRSQAMGSSHFVIPKAFAPACFGKRETPKGCRVHGCIRKCCAKAFGFTLIRDIEPGEAIYIESEGKLYAQQCADDHSLYPCILNMYFARPDSIMDGISVYKITPEDGRKLADKIMRLRPDHDIDVVMPIPDTSRTSAMQMAISWELSSGRFHEKSLHRRTFIMPGQSQRKSQFKKLNAIELEFKGQKCHAGG